MRPRSVLTAALIITLALTAGPPSPATAAPAAWVPLRPPWVPLRPPWVRPRPRTP